MANTTVPDAVAQGVLRALDEPASGMFDLSPEAHRVARGIGMAVLVVPLLGAAEGARLWLRHEVGIADVVLLVVMYGVTMGGVTMGLHRLLAHRAFSTSNGIQYLLAIMGSMAAQGSVLYWVATHRAHHAYSDTPADPSSPQLYGKGFFAQLKGLWFAHHSWILARRIASPSRLTRDLLRDRTLMVINQRYLVWVGIGLLLPAIAGALIHGSWFGAWSGFIYGGLARMFLCNQASFCVASICHMFGSRRFRTGDESKNNWLVAIPTFGEGLQNNHHAFPSYYRHAFRWWEPDLTGWCIGLLGWLGLARDLRHPPRSAMERLLLAPSGAEVAKATGGK